jgi:hypothetical protein
MYDDHDAKTHSNIPSRIRLALQIRIARRTMLFQLRIPAKANADSEGNANGIPGRRRTVFGA